MNDNKQLDKRPLEERNIHELLYLGEELEDKINSKLYESYNRLDREKLRRYIRYSIFDLKYGDYFRKLRETKKLKSEFENVLNEIEENKNMYSYEKDKKTGKNILVKEDYYYFNNKSQLTDIETQSFIDTLLKKYKNYSRLLNEELKELYNVNLFFNENRNLINSKTENRINDMNVVDYINHGLNEGLIENIYNDFLKFLKNKHKDKDIVIEKESLNLLNKSTWFHNFIEWLKSIFLNKKEPFYLKDKNDIFIDKTKKLHIIPAYTENHVSAIIVDNINKKILFFEPNGMALNHIDAFKDVVSKNELLKKLFSKNDVNFFKKNNYELINALDEEGINQYIFDKSIHHISPMYEGKCAVVVNKYIDVFIKKFYQRKDDDYKINDYDWFLTDIANINAANEQRMRYSQIHKMLKIAREKYKESFAEFDEYKQKNISSDTANINLEQNNIEKNNTIHAYYSI